MLKALRSWNARRRLSIDIDAPEDSSGTIRVRVANRSSRPLTINHITTAWPYRPEPLWRRIKGAIKHGQHWSTIGWTHNRLPELDRLLDLPTDLRPRQHLAFELPFSAIKGAWSGGEVVFVVRVRDVRGRNYYSRTARIVAEG